MNDASLREHVHHVVRTLVSERPAIYLPFARRKYPGPSPEVIGPETRFVIDGYTRSASTFAVYAFQTAQPVPVRMAHHLHAPAQLIAAAKAGVPALVVIREPEGCLLSQVIREPGVTIRDALFSYARFYEKLERYRSQYVVADFGQVTGDFGSVIRRINQRFGTDFHEFTHTEEHLRRCNELIRLRPTHHRVLLGFESGTATLGEVMAAGISAGSNAEVEDAWVPSDARRAAKQRLLEQWNHPSLDRPRARAQRVYRDFLAEPSAAGGSVVAAASPG